MGKGRCDVILPNWNRVKVFPEPCRCGAPDCKKCHPENYRNGKYIYTTCEKCGREYYCCDDVNYKICPMCKDEGDNDTVLENMADSERADGGREYLARECAYARRNK